MRANYIILKQSNHATKFNPWQQKPSNQIWILTNTNQLKFNLIMVKEELTQSINWMDNSLFSFTVDIFSASTCIWDQQYL